MNNKANPQLVTAYHRARQAAVCERVRGSKEIEEQAGWALRWGWQADQVRRFADREPAGTAAVRSRELLDEIRAGKIGAVFASEITRLGRDAHEVLQLIQECTELNVVMVLDGKVVDLEQTARWMTSGILNVLAEFDGAGT